MHQYLEHMQNILNNGVRKEDRTGTGTLSIFGHQMRFDLREGFPLVTTKKTHLKSIIHELLWFLRGETNINTLNATIWNEWRTPYRLKGRETVFIDPIRKDYVPYSGNFSWSGLGTKAGSVERMLANSWVRMMKRCYLESHEKFHFYGGKGASVCERWHNPANFIEDAKKLPHWFYKQKDWSAFELDKDYYGANQYGPETSVWLHTSENNMYTKASRPITVTTPNGVKKVFAAQNHAAGSIGVSQSTMSRFIKDGVPKVLKAGNKRYLGWQFEEAALEGKLARLELIEDGELGPVYGKQWRSWEANGGFKYDQIAEVIERLQTNPECRRLIVSAWNVGELDDMALMPCHVLFQFMAEPMTYGERVDLYLHNCSEEDANWFAEADVQRKNEILDEEHVPKHYLSCHLYQRSADWFLGVPFNIASYALLTMMIGKVVNMVPKDFVHSFGDTHLYLNHMDQAKEQLSRSPMLLPAMRIKDRGQGIDDFVYEDFELLGYNFHPAIKAPVAV